MNKAKKIIKMTEAVPATIEVTKVEINEIKLMTIKDIKDLGGIAYFDRDNPDIIAVQVDDGVSNELIYYMEYTPELAKELGAKKADMVHYPNVIE